MRDVFPLLLDSDSRKILLTNTTRESSFVLIFFPPIYDLKLRRRRRRNYLREKENKLKTKANRRVKFLVSLETCCEPRMPTMPHTLPLQIDTARQPSQNEENANNKKFWSEKNENHQNRRKKFLIEISNKINQRRRRGNAEEKILKKRSERKARCDDKIVMMARRLPFGGRKL